MYEQGIFSSSKSRATSPSRAADSYEALFPEAASRPVFAKHPLFSVLEPTTTTPGKDGKTDVVEMHFDASTDRHHTHLHYIAEPWKDRVHMSIYDGPDGDGVPDVQGVICRSDAALVKFDNAVNAGHFAQLLNVSSTLLTFLEEWGCDEGAHVRRVSASPRLSSANGTVVIVPTRAASIEHLFKNAKINFNGTRAVARERSSGTGVEAGGRDRRSWFDDDDDVDTTTAASGSSSGWLAGLENDVSSFFGSIEGDMESLWHSSLSKLETAAHDTATLEKWAEEAGKILTTGKLDYNGEPFEKNANVGPVACSSKTPDLMCSYSYDVEIHFQLEIADYKLQSISLSTTGDAEAGVQASGQGFTKTWDGAIPTETLYDGTLWSTVIPVAGVPIPLSLKGTVTSGLVWSVDGSLHIDGGVTAKGNVGAGITYTPSDGFSPTTSYDVTGTAALNYATGSLAAKGTVTISTLLGLTALYSAGVSSRLVVTPVIAATGTETIEGAAASFSSKTMKVTELSPTTPDYSSQCHPTAGSNAHVDTPSVALSVGVGVQLTASASLDIEALKIDKTYQFENGQPIWQKLWSPLKSWCVHL